MIGRKKEIYELNRLCELNTSSLLAVYGRRRIGKTYLINTMFSEHRTDCIFFEFTGMSNARTEIQINNFIDQVYEWFRKTPTVTINNWNDAFRFLKRTIDEIVKREKFEKKVILFFDEVPWIDASNKAGFLDALGYFWNTYCEKRKNVLVIICGSNASWIKSKVLEDAKGPLHNRVTAKLPMLPFTLEETIEYLIKEKHYQIDKKTATDIYMIFGGVAKYLSYLDTSKSLTENIDNLFFNVEGFMYSEFEKVFRSLFMDKTAFYKSIIEILASKQEGFSQKDIISALGITTGKRISDALDELQQCGFIKGISKFNQSKRDTVFIISDLYVLFHYKWIKNLSKNDIMQLPSDYWRSMTSSHTYSIWTGFSFETVVMINIEQYLSARERKGVFKGSYYWKYVSSNKEEKGAQIDLVVSYTDGLYDIVECKYYNKEFTITKSYEENLKHKLEMFKKYALTKKKYELRLVFLTVYGVKMNAVSNGLNIIDIPLEKLID